MSARETIMARVRSKLPKGPEGSRREAVELHMAQHPRNLIPARGQGDEAHRIRVFTEMMVAVGGTVEVIVAVTPLSYTYTQPVRVGVPFNAYHATLEARPVTATTSKIVYTFVYDNSMLADDAARAAEKANRTTRMMGAMQRMKAAAEAG